MKAIIMAGGLGTRLKPFTDIIPKPLLPVGEQSVLEIIINKLKLSGVNDVLLAINYKSPIFESYFGDGSNFDVNISYLKETKNLGTVGPLSNVNIENFKEPFIVMNADILTNLNFAKLFSFHCDKKADFTVVTKIVKTPLHYGVVESDNEEVTIINEKPTLESEIIAGIYIINPELISLLPKDEFYNMTDFIKLLISNNKKVVKFVIKDYWLDMGMEADYKKAIDDFKDGLI